MREIKFRAWDGKSMFNVEQITFNEAIWGCDKGRGVSIVFQPHIILMQFTGLHDKNGKEIYEGDILCWPKYEGKKNQIRWVVEWNNDRAGWTDWSPRNEAEVIGNIYENPELLNQ